MTRRAEPKKLVAGNPYSRAKDTLAECVSLLDGLSSHVPEAESGYVAALRTVVRFQMVELANEFGSLGGPRVDRVDHLFTLLLDHRSRMLSAEVGGLIGELGMRLGLSSGSVNTVDDEQNVTNFRILTDYITTLLQTWNARNSSR